MATAATYAYTISSTATARMVTTPPPETAEQKALREGRAKIEQMDREAGPHPSSIHMSRYNPSLSAYWNHYTNNGYMAVRAMELVLEYKRGVDLNCSRIEAANREAEKYVDWKPTMDDWLKFGRFYNAVKSVEKLDEYCDGLAVCCGSLHVGLKEALVQRGIPKFMKRIWWQFVKDGATPKDLTDLNPEQLTIKDKEMKATVIINWVDQ